MYLIQSCLSAVPLCADFSFLQLDQFTKCSQQLQVAGGSDVVMARQLHEELFGGHCNTLMNIHTDLNLLKKKYMSTVYCDIHVCIYNVHVCTI